MIRSFSKLPLVLVCLGGSRGNLECKASRLHDHGLINQHYLICTNFLSSYLSLWLLSLSAAVALWHSLETICQSIHRHLKAAESDLVLQKATFADVYLQKEVVRIVNKKIILKFAADIADILWFILSLAQGNHLNKWIEWLKLQELLHLIDLRSNYLVIFWALLVCEKFDLL